MSVVAGAWTIDLGTRVEFNKRRATVIAVDYDTQDLTLRYEGSGDGGVCLVSFAAVSGTRLFRILDLPPVDDDELIPDIDLVDDAAWEAAYEKEKHVLEVVSGYKTGDPTRAGRWEPRAEYSPGTSMESRYAAKAAELDIGISTIKGWQTRYSRTGMNPAALLDGRSTNGNSGGAATPMPGGWR